MNCDYCKLKKICKVKDVINEFYDDMTIKIYNCKYSDLTDGVKIEQAPRKDFKYSNDTSEYDDKINFKKREVKKVVKCKTCGGTDYEDCLGTCSICGTEVCGVCATYSDGKAYCKDCWENNNKKEVLNFTESLTEGEEDNEDS